METRKFALVSGLLLLAACTDSGPVAPTADGAASILAAKGGKPGKPGGGGDSFRYTITDLGGEAASDINSTGVLVGGRLGDPSPTLPEGRLLHSMMIGGSACCAHQDL